MSEPAPTMPETRLKQLENQQWLVRENEIAYCDLLQGLEKDSEQETMLKVLRWKICYKALIEHVRINTFQHPKIYTSNPLIP